MPSHAAGVKMGVSTSVKPSLSKKSLSSKADFSFNKFEESNFRKNELKNLKKKLKFLLGEEAKVVKVKKDLTLERRILIMKLFEKKKQIMNHNKKISEKQNDAKAKLFYDTLDSLPLFKAPVAKEDRSKMNAVFVMDDAELEKEFLDTCKTNGMIGVKGHRSVGGFRVSMYNALTIESVKVLTDLMKEFAIKKG